MTTTKLTNHDDTSTETLGGQGHNTSLRSDSADRLALVFSLSEERDERVSGVGDDGADNTSEVTGGEGDTELSTLVIGLLGGSEDVGVEELDDLLEEEELCHRVRDLITRKQCTSELIWTLPGNGRIE